jgi:hypothetical protein
MKQTIELFHTAFEKTAEHVVTIVVDGDVAYALELAYLCTQNDMQGEDRTSWIPPVARPGVTITPTPSVLAKGGCRSTSVGDYARVQDAHSVESFWRCARAGWAKIQSQEEVALVGEAAMLAGYRS